MESGELAALGRRHGLDLMVLFGSAVRQFDRLAPDPGRPWVGDEPDPEPRDIDIAVRSEHGGAEPDPLALLQELYELTGSERIDLMMLHRAGPVARQRALSRGRKLFESEKGVFAEAQIAAIMEYFDTEPLRVLGRQLLASQ